MNTVKKGIICGVTIAAASLSGCATVFSGTSQRINVQAVNEATNKVISSAQCVVRDPEGVDYAVIGNPGAVSVPREYGGLTVRCTAKGFHQKALVTGSSFNAMTLANVLFWPGAIVDVATGAAKKYPSHITVVMTTHAVKHPKTQVSAK